MSMYDMMKPAMMAKSLRGEPRQGINAGGVSTGRPSSGPDPVQTAYMGGGGNDWEQMGAGTATMAFLDAISAANSGGKVSNPQYSSMRFGRQLGTDPSRGVAGGTGVFAFGKPFKLDKNKK